MQSDSCTSFCHLVKLVTSPPRSLFQTLTTRRLFHLLVVDVGDVVVAAAALLAGACAKVAAHVVGVESGAGVGAAGLLLGFVHVLAGGLVEGADVCSIKSQACGAGRRMASYHAVAADRSGGKVTSIWGTPRGAGGMPARWKRPMVLLSLAMGRSPCSTWISTSGWLSAAVLWYACRA